jgi:hypothetical protein
VVGDAARRGQDRLAGQPGPLAGPATWWALRG